MGYWPQVPLRHFFLPLLPCLFVITRHALTTISSILMIHAKYRRLQADAQQFQVLSLHFAARAILVR